MTDEPTRRITVRVPVSQLDAVETLVEAGRYPNRSVAIRESIDRLLADVDVPQQSAIRTDGGVCSDDIDLQTATAQSQAPSRRTSPLPHGHSATPIGISVPSVRRRAANVLPQDRHFAAHRSPGSVFAIGGDIRVNHPDGGAYRIWEDGTAGSNCTGKPDTDHSEEGQR